MQPKQRAHNTKPSNLNPVCPQHHRPERQSLRRRQRRGRGRGRWRGRRRRQFPPPSAGPRSTGAEAGSPRGAKAKSSGVAAAALAERRRPRTAGRRDRWRLLGCGSITGRRPSAAAPTRLLLGLLLVLGLLAGQAASANSTSTAGTSGSSSSGSSGSSTAAAAEAGGSGDEDVAAAAAGHAGPEARLAPLRLAEGEARSAEDGLARLLARHLEVSPGYVRDANIGFLTALCVKFNSMR